MSDRPAPTPWTHVDLTPSLVVKLRDGDEHAGRMLASLYHDAILRFCWGYLGRREDAEDACQEVFWRVLRADEVPDNFRAWLYRIARNYCLNVIRDRGRREEKVGANLPTEPGEVRMITGNLTRLVRGEHQARMIDLIQQLPETQREILRLRYTEGLSRAEVAQILDLPESIVKSRLFEGVKRLRELASEL